MLDSTAVAIVLLVFLAAAIERAVEIVLAPLEGRQSTAVRRFFAMTLASALAVAIAFGLGLAPGSAFGPEGEGFVRWCFAASEDKLGDGVARLRRAL